MILKIIIQNTGMIIYIKILIAIGHINNYMGSLRETIIGNNIKCWQQKITYIPYYKRIGEGLPFKLCQCLRNLYLLFFCIAQKSHKLIIDILILFLQNQSETKIIILVIINPIICTGTSTINCVKFPTATSEDMSRSAIIKATWCFYIPFLLVLV